MLVGTRLHLGQMSFISDMKSDNKNPQYSENWLFYLQVMSRKKKNKNLQGQKYKLIIPKR